MSRWTTGFGDDTTLWDLRNSFLESSLACGVSADEASEVSDENLSVDSSVDSESGSEDRERRAVLDGERNALDLVAPSDLVDKECFEHKKSGKMHLVNRTLHGSKYFKRGRKCNDNYCLLSSVPAFGAHGCMTCFGWSSKPSSDSSD